MNDIDALMLTPSQAKDALINVLKARCVPFLQGSPGVAKSAIIKDIADHFKLKLIDVRLSQVEPCDLLGFPFAEGGRADYKPMKMFPLEGDALPEDKNGWLLFFDEFNSAPRDVQAAAYRIVLDREIGTHKLHNNCFICCAGNLSTDKAIVNKLSTALASRLVHLFMSPSVEDWVAWALNNDIDERVIAYIQNANHKLMEFDPNSQDITYPCPRTWHMLSRIIKPMVDLKHAHSLISGTIGQGTAFEFRAFADLSKDCPTLEEIKNNPTSAPIPEKPGAMYFVATCIAANMDKDSYKTYLEYMNRFQAKEIIVLIYRMACKGKHAAELIKQAEFKKNAVRFLKDLGV